MTGPVLAVVHDLGSASPLEIWHASRGICDLLFLVEPHSEPEWLAMLGELGAVVPMDVDVAHLRRRSVAGITTFSEFRLVHTSQLAEALGVPFHGAQVVRTLTHKPTQRAALAQHGVDRVRCVAFRAEDGAPAYGEFPAVLKPAIGAGSRDTYLVRSRPELDRLVRELRCGELVLEEVLVGDASVAGPGWGDYVSVDSVVSRGAIDHFAVVGKLPLADPFRETGMLLPATIGGPVLQDVRDLATRAVAALGIQDGVTHTEIKLTAAGPRIIEVNGRLGGYVADIVRRAGGPDPVRLAILAALGMALPPLAFTTSGVTYQCFLPAPSGRRRVRAISGLDTVRGIPGVQRVVVQVKPGDVVDWREGTGSHLGLVNGSAGSHDELLRLATDGLAAVEVTYDPD